MTVDIPVSGDTPNGAPSPLGESHPPEAPREPGFQVLPSDLPQFSPLVTYVIIGLTVLVYIAQLGSPYLFGYDLPAALGMKVNELIAQGELWRLLTPLLLHGSLLHIGFNMYALNVIGPGLERSFGHRRFLLLYLLAGFAGNVVSMTFTDAPSLGASTAIFGLFGAQGVFIYQNRILFGERAQAALGQIVRLAVINLLIGLSPGIDNWGHVGGLAGGVAFTWLAGPLLGWQGIAPSYRLADRRDPNAVWLAAVGIGLLFAMLAGAVVMWRGV